MNHNNNNNNNRHSPLNTIANAPEVPSSNTQMPYFDPRNTSTNYFPSGHSHPPVVAQPLYTLDMNSAAAAAASVVDVNNSLPPLSHLLPNKSTTKQDTADYFSPQTKSMSTVPSQPQSYRKSDDYQRAIYPPPPPPLSSDRRYIPTGGGPSSSNNEDNPFYMLPQASTNYPPPPSTIVPSSNHNNHPNGDMSSMYSIPPHPYRNHLNQPHYHLPSPPTSVIDGVLVNHYHHNHHPHDYHHPNNQHVVNGGITNNSQKVFSFVPLPGLNQKKRPRRKFHEVERLYQCNYQDCTKSYGTLNHLNAHVSMQRHGNKRQPTEFKELRKMWRKQKRDNKQQRSGSRSTSDSIEEEQPEMMMNSSILSHHHDYTMPPYMQHPSLLSHPPPPPPPTLWRPHYPPPSQSSEFMPPPPPGY